MPQNENGKNVKNSQLQQYRAGHQYTDMTTNQGLKLEGTDDSLKAGPRGPTLLEDFHLREKITHFDHERIPERVVHARGFGAHGFFQVYTPMKAYTKAKFLQDPSAITPVFVRFSTVVGSRGSADTVRDVRGFATKFYTEEGNYDIVGNNMPVFFIQDAIKFPDLVHAIKPEPLNEIPQASSAHDTFWDFVVNAPETAHMVMWLMSDRAIPRSFRMMEGFGVNTFRLVNDMGVARFVKFHWKPLLGVHSLVWEEAQKISGMDPDFHRRDLWNAIESGEYPEYELGIQIIEEKDEPAFDFDILDPTKIWPEELVPVEIIGKMTLNKNTDNFFAETEQVAFCPANIVPGIDFSNDPLLQGRLFSYHDTQLSRLGGPNFHQIPINRPVVPVHNNQRDGRHQMRIDIGITGYATNMLEENYPRTVPENMGGFRHYAERVDGKVIRQRSPSFADHFGQARLFYNSMTEPEKQHILQAFQFEVGKVKDKRIRQRVADMFCQVDFTLACKIAEAVAAAPPKEPPAGATAASSPALSQENTIRTAKTRKVAILAENGFNYDDIASVMDQLKKAGVHSEIVAANQGMLSSDDGRQMEAAQSFRTAASALYDGVYIPGGKLNADQLCMQGDAIRFVNEAFRHFKAIAAANEGVALIEASSIKNVQTAPEESRENVFSHLGVVTIRHTNNLTAFSNEFISAVAAHRHFSRSGMIPMIPA